jgi:hypothetical protein
MTGSFGQETTEASAAGSAATTAMTAFQNSLEYPRLRENIWQIMPGEPAAYVETLDSLFEVPTEQALSFMNIRTHCTGHNSIEEIAIRSRVPAEIVRAKIYSLFTAGLLVPPQRIPNEGLPAETARARLKQIGEIWGRELTRHFVANELLDDGLSKDVLVGWLLEMYHYVKDFPEIIAYGGTKAAGRLAELYARYASEESGHEEFVVRTLMNIGLTRAEIEASSPLVSTRLIGFLMRELFEFEPATVLLVASIIEAHETPEDQLDAFQRQLERRYDLRQGDMAPYFQHQLIDVALGHSKLLEDNLELFAVRNVAALDRIVDKMHDLKHAFELQSSEIKSYYGNLSGMYFPRQPMTFSAL